MRKRFRKGMIVEVEFLDHVEDGNEPIAFTAYGRLVDVQRKFIIVESWAYFDTKIIRDSNVKFWVILRSAITQWYQLERKEQ